MADATPTGRKAAIGIDCVQAGSPTDGQFFLLPPARDLCQTCAAKHEPHLPHNAQSLYYQTAFNIEHGRAPDWRDATAHCSPEMRAIWREKLIEAGVDFDGGGIRAISRKAAAK
jgi:hypothetical protein